jgi:hypothetical protein
MRSSTWATSYLYLRRHRRHHWHTVTHKECSSRVEKQRFFKNLGTPAERRVVKSTTASLTIRNLSVTRPASFFALPHGYFANFPTRLYERRASHVTLG